MNSRLSGQCLYQIGPCICCSLLLENIDQTLLNELLGPMHYKSGVPCVYNGHEVLNWNIDQTLMNSLHGLLNCEIGGLHFVLFQQSIYLVSLNKHVTPILQCIDQCMSFIP